MILETTRIIAEWLDDATYGVNALASSVPMDTGVSEFPAVTVLNSTEHGATARGQIPADAADLPALLVTPADQPADQMVPGVRPWPADQQVTVLVRYATSKTDTAAAERDASQTIRAVMRSLGQLMLQDANGANRTRAQVALVSIRSMQAATLYEANQDVIVTGGVLVTCHVRDFWAQS